MKSMMISMLIVLAVGTNAFAGGMSGGGGNVINPIPPKRPANPDRVDEMIDLAFKGLPTFLKHQEQAMLSGKMDPAVASLYAKIFNGSPNIYDAMNNRKLHVEEDKNCFNSFNVAYDASIVAPEPNSVCISAFSISKKVTLNEIHAQVSALLVHEYSEVMGLDDDQAIEIQKVVLANIEGYIYAY